MSPKIPPFIFLVFCNRTNVKKIPKGPFFQIFRHYETVENSHFLFFLKIFQVSLQFFKILQQNGWLKNLKVPPFTVFGIVRFFQIE